MCLHDMLCCFTERDEVSSSSPVLFLPGSGFAQHLITQRCSPATEFSLHLQLSLSISLCMSVCLSVSAPLMACGWLY